MIYRCSVVEEGGGRESGVRVKCGPVSGTATLTNHCLFPVLVRSQRMVAWSKHLNPTSARGVPAPRVAKCERKQTADMDTPPASGAKRTHMYSLAFAHRATKHPSKRLEIPVCVVIVSDCERARGEARR